MKGQAPLKPEWQELEQRKEEKWLDGEVAVRSLNKVSRSDSANFIRHHFLVGRSPDMFNDRVRKGDVKSMCRELQMACVTNEDLEPRCLGLSRLHV